MQIVIDIDDNLYTRLFDNGVDNYDDAVDMAKAIRKGTPLPKGHGRLIDADKIEYFESSLVPHIYSDIVVRKEFIDAMPTILDAKVKNDD